MQEVPSLPKFDLFMKLLEDTRMDNIDSYANEPLISPHTFNMCMCTYTRDQCNKLMNYIENNSITIGPAKSGYLGWSRFEDAHLPCLSNGVTTNPQRVNIDEYVYTIYSPRRFSIGKNESARVHLGYKVVVPKGKALLLNICDDFIEDFMLLGPGIITNSEAEELEVVIHAIRDSDVEHNAPLLKAIFISVETLNTDIFVPRPRVKNKEVVKNEDTKYLDIEVKSPEQEITSVEPLVAQFNGLAT